MTTPTLSIVVPTYNSEKTLKNALFSILMDPFKDLEIIVVDDGSTDNTQRLLAEFMKLDRRIRVLAQENRGVSAARNSGVSAANGALVGFLDADDIFLKNSIVNRMNALAADTSPNVVGVFCPAVYLDIDRKPLMKSLVFDYDLPENKFFFNSTPEGLGNPSAVILKKHRFTEAGGFDESLIGGEDFDLWYRILRRGGYFLKVDTCQVGWTQHPSSAVHKDPVAHFDACKRAISKLFSDDAEAVDAHRPGFGGSIFNRTVTHRAFFSAVASVVKGDRAAAQRIAADISKHALQSIPSTTLFESIRRKVLTTLCLPESQWPVVWPRIKPDIIAFLSWLDLDFGHECDSLRSLLSTLETYSPKLKVFCVLPSLSEATYAAALDKLSGMDDIIDQVFFPTDQEDFFGAVRVPLSNSCGFSLSGELRSAEERLTRKICLFPAGSPDIRDAILSKVNAYTVLEPQRDGLPDGSFSAQLFRTDMLNIDACVLRPL